MPWEKCIPGYAWLILYQQRCREIDCLLGRDHGSRQAGMTTEHDKSRDDSARLIAEIPAAVALFDRDLRYIAVSAAWADAFELDSADVTGHRHGEISAAGRATLEHVQ